MKKLFIIGSILIILGAGFWAVYEALSNKEEVVETDFVEQTIAMDKEYVFLNYPDSVYDQKHYYSTCILMDTLMDSDSVDIEGVSNVFQVQIKDSIGTKCEVFSLVHRTDGTYGVDSVEGFWIENWDLFEFPDTIPMISFTDAFDSLKVNVDTLPHSRYVVLRWAIGPNPRDTFNPQYIFGNATRHYYIDAVTGKVSDVDPSGLPEDESDPYLNFD